MLASQPVVAAACHGRRMGRSKAPPTPEEVRLRHALAEYLSRRIDEVCEGNQTQFAKRTGIAQPDVSNAVSRAEGRSVSIGMLAKVAATVGPAMPELLAELGVEYARQRANEAVRIAGKLAATPGDVDASRPTVGERPSGSQPRSARQERAAAARRGLAADPDDQADHTTQEPPRQPRKKKSG